jgi:3',5'-cyclic AMP phosphodiesterase CpdA
MRPHEPPPKLWAIGDLHVGHAENRRAVERIGHHERDWLVLAGDMGEKVDDLRFVLETLAPRFARLLWVPGNHELWTTSDDGLRGEAKYAALVALCRARGVLTPEDPFPLFESEGGPRVVAPLFTLYDYTFGPEGASPDEARAWALEDGVVCADERRLHPDPHESREAWCAARCALSEERLTDARRRHDGVPFVLVSHYPLLVELAFLPRVPRFRVWCGTQRTRDWAHRFGAEVVVYGHLHMPGMRMIDGVRYEDVSFGYPREWRRTHGAEARLRRIL